MTPIERDTTPGDELVRERHDRAGVWEGSESTIAAEVQQRRQAPVASEA